MAGVTYEDIFGPDKEGKEGAQSSKPTGGERALAYMASAPGVVFKGLTGLAGKIVEGGTKATTSIVNGIHEGKRIELKKQEAQKKEREWYNKQLNARIKYDADHNLKTKTKQIDDPNNPGTRINVVVDDRTAPSFVAAYMTPLQIEAQKIDAKKTAKDKAHELRKKRIDDGWGLWQRIFGRKNSAGGSP